jgi:hypothetical protein
VNIHYLFAEFKANSNLQISKRFLFAEKSASCNPDVQEVQTASGVRYTEPNNVTVVTVLTPT